MPDGSAPPGCILSGALEQREIPASPLCRRKGDPMKKRAVLTQAVFLSAMFSIPAFAETVVACTSDGTLYVHVVGSNTVTVKSNGCQGGPWVIRASVAVRGSLQITPGSG